MADRERYTYKEISSIIFGMFSPKLIKQMASAKIVTPELYDKEGYPVDGGLMDIRLGVIDPGLKCKTCGSKLKECIGHFGYIELARPIVHIYFVPLLLNLLRCTCRECGKVLIPQSKVDQHSSTLHASAEHGAGLESRRKKIKEIIAGLKTITKCPHCKAKQLKITLEKPYTFIEGDKRVSPIEIRTRLEKISDDDALLFGINAKFARPEWTIITVLPIPPVTIRPSITLESGERSEDDLTHKLGDIVRINQRLFENINAGAPEIIIEDLWDLLQYHITTFFNNEVAQLPPARHRSGQPLKTISERIKSKEGRIRHNLAGKRTNFSARTVISPDPMIAINEVGVPKVVAMKLTVPERVTEWNMAYLKAFVQRGPKQYPGSNYIVRPDGKKKKITDETQEQLLEELQPGYLVERHLMDGDVAIFNRQPSLHRMSMMAHRIRVLPNLTFRLNPAVCHPYNADFDGDEMNLHIPQTEEARAEAEMLMMVENQLISPRYGLSVIGCVQDAVSGNYVLTKDMDMSREDAIDLLLKSGITSFDRLPEKGQLHGRDVFSMLLPEDFSFSGHSKSCKSKEAPCKDPAHVFIKKGKLLSGIMDSANLGQGAGLLLRTIHKNYGHEYAIDFLSKVFRLGIQVLQKKGFSTALSDTDLPEDAAKNITEILNKAEADVDHLISLYHNKELDIFPGKTLLETLELRILELLNKARNETGKVVTDHARDNTGTIVMTKSGARGTIINMAQIAACVGQQALRGGRINKGFDRRTLACFKRDDLMPAAHGFIRNGFKSGMTPNEFFFACMTGRDSLMDTALRTPKSGYLYRRLANAMQDLKVEYDHTVRDAARKIVQFQYGEDGIDVSKSEGGAVNVKRIIAEIIGE
ncbi:DNA-directed RNA polymerase subunit A' [Candidatus Woesearchaeota archaeon]|nr:DNA-directed RNA polymerase subunit A' [Candidatus Woesearchaeota archaeon]